MQRVTQKRSRKNSVGWLAADGSPHQATRRRLAACRIANGQCRRSSPLTLAYGRGRPRPLFTGAAPKMILATQPTGWFRACFEAHGDAANAAGMGADWSEFRAKLRALRKLGFYISRGELEPTLCAIAAPIPPSVHQESAATVAVVTSAERFALLNVEMLTSLVRQAAWRITEDLKAG